MSFIDLKNATVGKLVESENNTNLWVLDKLPDNLNPVVEILIASAESNDTITDVIKKWLRSAGIEPHRLNNKRDRQFEDLIKHNPWLVFVVENANLVSKKSFTEFFRIAEKTKGLILQGNILELGGKIFDNERFMQRADIGLHVNDIFE